MGLSEWWDSSPSFSTIFCQNFFVNIMNIFLFNRKCLLGTSWNDRFELHDPIGPCPALSGLFPSVPLGLPCEGHWPSWTSVDPTWVVPGAIRPRPLARPAKEPGAEETPGWPRRPMGDPWETHGRPMESLWNTFPLQKWSGSLTSTTRSKMTRSSICTRIGRQQKMNKIIQNNIK